MVVRQGSVIGTGHPDLDVGRAEMDSAATDTRHWQYGGEMPAALIPVIVLLAILAIDVWVYADAQQRAGRGTPVVVRIGAFVLETPQMWFIGCLILWIIFFPLYMVSRAG